VVEEERHLIVSSGLGFSKLPVRLGVPPELVVVELGA
jgi:predicted MPP superfamily phosphohydrolase